MVLSWETSSKCYFNNIVYSLQLYNYVQFWCTVNMELYLSPVPRGRRWERCFSETDWDAAHSESQAPRRPIDVKRNAVPATATIICQTPSPLQRPSPASPLP